VMAGDARRAAATLTAHLQATLDAVLALTRG